MSYSDVLLFKSLISHALIGRVVPSLRSVSFSLKDSSVFIRFNIDKAPIIDLTFVFEDAIMYIEDTLPRLNEYWIVEFCYDVKVTKGDHIVFSRMPDAELVQKGLVKFSSKEK